MTDDERPTTAWLIKYEDPDRETEVFSGWGAEDAAARRFRDIGTSWNATLFRSYEDNFSVPANERPVYPDRFVTIGDVGYHVAGPVAHAIEVEARKAIEVALRRVQVFDGEGDAILSVTVVDQVNADWLTDFLCGIEAGDVYDDPVPSSEAMAQAVAAHRRDQTYHDGPTDIQFEMKPTPRSPGES